MVPMRERTVILEPGMIRVDVTTPSGSTVVLSSDNKAAWREMRGLGFGLLQPADVNKLFMGRDPAFFGKLASLYTSCEERPSETRDGVRYDVYLMRIRKAEEERWFFDSGTGLLSRIEGGKAPLTFISEYSDYRQVGPLRLPFEFRLTVGATRVYAVHRATITLNVPLSQPYFAAMSWDLAEAARAQAILDRYLASCANPQSFSGWRSRIVRATIDTPALGVVSERTISLLSPNKILIDTDTKGLGHTLMGFDGATGWAYSEIQGYHALKAAQLPMLYSSLSILGYPTIGSDAPLRRIVGSRVIGGRKATALALSSLRDPIGTFYFDDGNGYLLRFGTQKQSAGGTRPVETIDFSDYRKVNGLAIPFEVIETTASLQVITKLKSVEDNTGVDASIFKPRAED